MSKELLDQVCQIVQQDPHSAQALLLFALMKTLDIEKGGHLYMLVKLKEFSPEHRQLAYGLMEMMAENKIHDEYWQRTLETMESAIRANP